MTLDEARDWSECHTGRRGKSKTLQYTVDGILFDNKFEAERYVYLKNLYDNGVITELEVQKTFELIPPQYNKVTKKRIESGIYYTADFYYIDEKGKEVVEDVRIALTNSSFLCKRKMMLYFYGIRVTEIRVDPKEWEAEYGTLDTSKFKELKKNV